ncbi:antibiotic biosynthesis monooxygenase family protein [Metabacillus iocasae]|uniref:Heme-degrading monooxygenase HmoA n=1 Tax=Priestia iocasae TaxID=2291674 RepID=A0ABS2QV35_9BACI|nr:antibiotic biosynthesis monooxygenase family protein [Metabacillus iocasae]MBM7702792.1 heme-degrading monooxygenase HmoA [Metabacillus iocasae]
MIIEHAHLTIKGDLHEEFVEAINKGIHYVKDANGYEGYELIQNIENNNQFLLMIAWTTMEDHTEHFVKSEAFAKWEELISPYFSHAPTVLHYHF